MDVFSFKLKQIRNKKLIQSMLEIRNTSLFAHFIYVMDKATGISSRNDFQKYFDTVFVRVIIIVLYIFI